MMNIAETLLILNHNHNTTKFTLRVKQIDIRRGSAALVGKPLIRWEAALVVNTELFDTNPDVDFEAYADRNLFAAYGECLSEAISALDASLRGAVGIVNRRDIDAAILRIAAGG